MKELVGKQLKKLSEHFNYKTIIENGKLKKFDKKDFRVNYNINVIANAIIVLASDGNKEAIGILEQYITEEKK